MRILAFAAVSLLAACAPRPAATPTPATASEPAADPDDHDHRTVNGMTASKLIQHFGRPRLQVIEGQGTKLQFAGPNCFMDVYLYPPAGGAGVPRATYIEARNPQGGNISAQSCAAAIERR